MVHLNWQRAENGLQGFVCRRVAFDIAVSVGVDKDHQGRRDMLVETHVEPLVKVLAHLARGGIEHADTTGCTCLLKFWDGQGVNAVVFNQSVVGLDFQHSVTNSVTQDLVGTVRSQIDVLGQGDQHTAGGVV